jgi:hypothetical protein
MINCSKEILKDLKNAFQDLFTKYGNHPAIQTFYWHARYFLSTQFSPKRGHLPFPQTSFTEDPLPEINNEIFINNNKKLS